MYIICGKKLALCCATMSVWGIIQLTFMGILLYSHAVAFAEDLEIEYEPNESPISFYGRAFGKYESAAHNCWIAVCIYILTFCASMSQYYFARKEAYGF